MIMLIIGYAFGSVVMKTVAFAFLFVINYPLINDNLDYQSGHTDTVSGALTTREYTFDEYNARTFGFFQSILALFGVGFSVYEEYKARKKEREEG